jgi:hypothetical protein
MRRMWIVLFAIVSMNSVLLSSCPITAISNSERADHGGGGMGGGGGDSGHY